MSEAVPQGVAGILDRLGVGIILLDELEGGLREPGGGERVGVRPEQVGGARRRTCLPLASRSWSAAQSLGSGSARASLPESRGAILGDERGRTRSRTCGPSVLARPGGASVAVTLVDASARLRAFDELNRLRGNWRRPSRRAASGRSSRPRAISRRRPTSSAAQPMLRVFEQIERVATADATVLVHGGPARARTSSRGPSTRDRAPAEAFIAVNCRRTLIESNSSATSAAVAGAFGSARRTELADQGTLFLDEIAELARGGSCCACCKEPVRARGRCRTIRWTSV